MNSNSQPLSESYSGRSLSQSPSRFMQLFRSLCADKYVASVVPSSRYTIRTICDFIDFQTARNIIEFGPGDGVVTAELLKNMRFDGRLLALENNEQLADTMRQNFSSSKLQLLHASAEDVKKVCSRKDFKADVVVSGIPFSMFDEAKIAQILSDTRDCLTPDGSFIFYQVWAPPFCNATKLRTRMLHYFKVDARKIVLRNILPMQVALCKKLNS